MLFFFFFLRRRRPPRSTQSRSSAASDVYKRQVDTDGDSTPDFLDTDSDNDGIPDSTEAYDYNRDGIPDIVPSGNDSDGDGLDDAYDTITAPDSNNSTGSHMLLPVVDDGTTSEIREIDEDGDGIPDRLQSVLPETGKSISQYVLSAVLTLGMLAFVLTTQRGMLDHLSLIHI